VKDVAAWVEKERREMFEKERRQENGKLAVKEVDTEKAEANDQAIDSL
jgi:hypothetical protein